MIRGHHAIELGDVVEVLKGYRDDSFDAVLCDPPYGLSFLGKRWDYDVPSASLWREVLRVCKPGAPLIAFSGTRTYHRTVIQIEDAGFEIRDCIAWMYGSGFPKSLDVSKAIDKRRDDRADILGVTAFLRAAARALAISNAEIDKAFDRNGMAGHWTSSASQPAVPTWEQWLTLKQVLALGDEMDAEVWRLNGRKGEAGQAWIEANVVGEYKTMPPGLVGHQFSRRDALIRAPSEVATEWAGYGTALKPAFEPAVLARKPLDGTVAENVARWGVGALAIDASRIGTEGGGTDCPHWPSTCRGHKSAAGAYDSNHGNPPGGWPNVVQGRWPANVILDEEAGAMLDTQTGVRPSAPYRANTATGTVLPLTERTAGGYADTGGASRFFYCSKASKKERDIGCEDMPELSGGEMTGRKNDSAGTNSPRAGAGRTGGARNHHPTVKPLALTEYLARLIMPPKPGVILVPFAGSGSEMIGALRAGWPGVVGIERDSAYVEIARRRLRAA